MSSLYSESFFGPRVNHTPLAVTSVWVKWCDRAPLGFVNTGVYNASSDSYLWQRVNP